VDLRWRDGGNGHEGLFLNRERSALNSSFATDLPRRIVSSALRWI
jgi:hypothetical protein